VLRRDVEQLELQRQQRRVGGRLVDVGIDPAHEGRNDHVTAVVIMVELGGQVSAESMEPRPDVPL